MRRIDSIYGGDTYGSTNLSFRPIERMPNLDRKKGTISFSVGADYYDTLNGLLRPHLKRAHEKASDMYFLLRALRIFGFNHLAYDVLASLFAGGNTSSLRNILNILEEQGLLGIEKGESFKNSNGFRYFGPNLYYPEPFPVNLDPKSKARLGRKSLNTNPKSSDPYAYKVIRNHGVYRFVFRLGSDHINKIVSVSIKKELKSAEFKL